MAPDPEVPLSFTDFPEDILVNILSFLSPIEISVFACTCRRFASLCSSSSPSADLWFAIWHRRWGSKICLRRWPAVPSPRLYRTFDLLEHLIGLWRRIGSGAPDTPPFLFFEWGPSFITGYSVSQHFPSLSSYAVQKIPFVSSAGDSLGYLHPHYLISHNHVIPLTISYSEFSGFMVEESSSFCPDAHLDDSMEVFGLDLKSGSLPVRVMSEIYQCLANRKRPRGEKRVTYRRRLEKEWERLWLTWGTEYFVKIAPYCQTPVRPLQELWKAPSIGEPRRFHQLPAIKMILSYPWQRYCSCENDGSLHTT